MIISKKHETGFKFWNFKHMKARQRFANFTALEALICTWRITERTTSCYMSLESTFLALSCCQAGFSTILVLHLNSGSEEQKSLGIAAPSRHPILSMIVPMYNFDTFHELSFLPMPAFQEWKWSRNVYGRKGCCCSGGVVGLQKIRKEGNKFEVRWRFWL